ncbi:hypothetical protein BDV38DRAFT_236583 [Aspergillus pseudotamarii]|uniref:Uncharacterized protein n=1 Tax=Aspergillus pseudotamarii TaxID=132259 RepID=A0A5N6T6C2_ASPPS|nr:uncharacterized protein BDV38DRAFT_236583 [Aspergillus pseudotamarii]KAE8141878.1 hypothetical protein BDV38DRAFT_236583 [Aspergillus pseudotamarii]
MAVLLKSFVVFATPVASHREWAHVTGSLKCHDARFGAIFGGWSSWERSLERRWEDDDTWWVVLGENILFSHIVCIFTFQNTGENGGLKGRHGSPRGEQTPESEGLAL